MAVLKVWDGSQWVPVGTGAPAVASPLTVSAGGVLDIQQASASLEGSMSAADFAKVQHILEVATNDVNYRSEAGAAFFSGRNNAHVGGNVYWDGTQYQRYTTANPASLLAVVGAARGQFDFYNSPSGANPAAQFLGARLQDLGAGQYQQLNLFGSGSNMLVGSGSGFHLGSNCYFDGTAWQRHNTGGACLLLKVGSNGALDLYYAPAGVNPITFTAGYNLFDAANKPPVARTAITTFAAGFSAYPGFETYYHRDALGYVHLEGLANKGSAIVNGEAVLTMPVGFRPVGPLSLVTNSSTVPSAASMGTNGVFNSYAAGATYCSLSNIHYLAA